MLFKYISSKHFKTIFLAAALLIVVSWACKPGDSPIAYSVTIKAADNTNLPALQSFAHGTNGPDWLLFAGRTNNPDTSFSGGLHNQLGNTNYASNSFIPRSFNENMYVYNIDSNKMWQMPVATVIEKLEKILKVNTINESIFVSSNPLVTQDGEYLYLLGGYGPNPDTSNYGTYNQITQIHVPSMISLIKGDMSGVDNSKILHFGTDPSNKLISTGGELFKIDNTFYMAGGQNFGNSAPNPNNQTYTNAVFPFTISTSGNSGLTVNVGTPITNVPVNSLGPNYTLYADSLSIFRRRDAPIVPALYTINGSFVQGITFYAGVFKYQIPSQNTLEAWNDAIYVYPGHTVNGKSYTYDSLYNQSNHSVYACADFEAYDPFTNTLHTFLLGGIGTGKMSSNLSSFTNDGVHIVLNMDSLKSSRSIINKVFPVADTSHFYGTESEFILNRIGTRATDPVFAKASNSKETEVVDISKSFTDGKLSILIGYVYGGIESFQLDPGTFGKGKSGASNKLWEVWLNIERH